MLGTALESMMQGGLVGKDPVAESLGLVEVERLGVVGSLVEVGRACWLG